MFKDETKAIIESLLFVSSEPLHLDTISEIVGAPKDDIIPLLEEMKKDLEKKDRGILLLEIGNGYQLATKPQYYEFIEKLYKPNISPLSQAALETLAIIAYRQPITRSEIEIIRGVKCDRVLTTLLERGLIEEQGRKEGPGRPILYGTSDKFLSYFGLTSLDELPDVEEFQEKLKAESGE
ncbi:MAG: segregation and condensation protein [Clostridia bacterium]|nr:segregation and condensation protein [Clostridia bacterium]